MRTVETVVTVVCAGHQVASANSKVIMVSLFRTCLAPVARKTQMTSAYNDRKREASGVHFHLSNCACLNDSNSNTAP
eukprot:6079319-Pyramimonas_sp.AAC.1